MKTTSLPRLSVDDFEATVPHLTRSSEDSIKSLRAILVDGQPVDEVAASFAVGRAVLYRKVSHFVKLYTERVQGVPKGFMRFTVVLPFEDAQATLRRSKILLEHAK